MNNLCGLRLSTIGVIVGWVNLIGALFTTIILCVAFTRLDEVVKIIENQMTDGSNTDVNMRTAVIIGLCVYLTTSIANIISSIFLIVGTIKERHLLLAPWLINAYIFIFFNILNFFYIIYFSFVKGVPFGSILYTILITCFSLVVQCTIWNAIYSLFKQIRANRDLQQRLLPTSSPSYQSYSKMPPTVE